MIKIKKYLLASCLLLVFTSTFATTKHENEAAVQKAFYAWCAAIGQAKGNPQVVVKYYAPGAILLPTLSEEILVNKKGGLDGYFKKLTSLPDIQCTPQKLITRVYTDTAVNSGLYKFTYKNDKGHPEIISARFTFVYQKYDNQWLINKHHSSKMPE